MRLLRALGLIILPVAGLIALAGCRGETASNDRSGLDGSSVREDSRTYMGREIGMVRGADAAQWFDRPEREYSELPNRLVRSLPLAETDVVADIGAGTGYFTFRLSEVVPRGRVLAVDIDPDMLDLIRVRRDLLGADNIELIHSTPQNPRLPDQSVDLALLVDSYHEFSHPREMLEGVFHGLRPGGYLVIVEYRAEDSMINVESGHEMTEAQIRLEVETANFEWVETRDFLPRQHVVIFRRPVG